MENIIKTYPCGLRLVVRPMPNFKSVATAVYVGVGSRDEETREFGISHFVEHMLFKGTARRSSEDIAQTLSSLGVQYNAFTSTDATCYHTKGLASNLDTCCDVLSDMYFNLKFSEDDFRREAEVIVQEIMMRDDHPRMALGELSAKTFFDGTVYGHDIAGSVESVRGIAPKDIYGYIKRHYIAPKTMISFAGDITLATAEAMVAKYFLPQFNTASSPVLQVPTGLRHAPKGGYVSKVKDIEQQNVAIIFPTVNNSDPDKYALTFLSDIFSGDMSSRLFASVREKLGLVYTISGGSTLTNIGGYYYIYFSCTPDNTELVIKTVASEIKKLKSKGVTAAEVEKVKNIRLSRKLFEAENVEAISIRNVTLLSEFNEIETIEQYIEKINAVTIADVNRVIGKFLNYDNAVIALVGREVAFAPMEVLKQ